MPKIQSLANQLTTPLSQSTYPNVWAYYVVSGLKFATK